MKNTPNETKLNNKGFSLVELIIVIAIMAVLVGVLAPQFLKYVEKSRESADLDNYRAIISAVQVYGTDKGLTGINPTNGDTFVLVAEGAATSSSATGTFVNAALTNAGIDITGITTKSKNYSGKTIKFEDDGGNLKVTANDATLAKALGIKNY